MNPRSSRIIITSTPSSKDMWYHIYKKITDENQLMKEYEELIEKIQALSRKNQQNIIKAFCKTNEISISALKWLRDTKILEYIDENEKI